jgi:anti-anti-sigma regulatory factor
MTCTDHHGILKVSPGAAVDTSTLSGMAAGLLAALSNAEAGTPVEIDLLETADADSGTLKFLLAASSDCRQRRLKLTVRAGGKTGELLQLTSLARHMNLILEEPSK